MNTDVDTRRLGQMEMTMMRRASLNMRMGRGRREGAKNGDRRAAFT